MGSCLASDKPKYSNDTSKIYGPVILSENPIKFVSNNSIWKLDFEYFARQIVDAQYESKSNEYNLSLNVILIILQYINKDIKKALQIPKQLIIKIALEKQQNYNIHNKSIWSIYDGEIITEHLIENEYFFERIITIPQEIKSKYKIQHINEIIVYQNDDHHNINDIDRNIKNYNYILLLIPPNIYNYKGGEFIINKQTINNNSSNWQSIFYHKNVKHKYKQLIGDQYKVVFKIYMSLKKGKQNINMENGFDATHLSSVPTYDSDDDGVLLTTEQLFEKINMLRMCVQDLELNSDDDNHETSRVSNINGSLDIIETNDNEMQPLQLYREYDDQHNSI